MLRLWPLLLTSPWVPLHPPGEPSQIPLVLCSGLQSSHTSLLTILTHTQLSTPSLPGGSLCLASRLLEQEGELYFCQGPLGYL